MQIRMKNIKRKHPSFPGNNGDRDILHCSLIIITACRNDYNDDDDDDTPNNTYRNNVTKLRLFLYIFFYSTNRKKNK